MTNESSQSDPVALEEPWGLWEAIGMMRTRFHLTPGQHGTKQLLTPYVDRLVCGRSRDEAQRKKRFKTVEIMVAEREWDPPAPRCTAATLVGVRVGFAEADMRDRVQQADRKWNRRRKVWDRRYDQVVALTLEARIVEEEASHTRYHDEKAKHLDADAWRVSTSRCLSL